MHTHTWFNRQGPADSPWVCNVPADEVCVHHLKAGHVQQAVDVLQAILQDLVVVLGREHAQRAHRLQAMQSADSAVRRVPRTTLQTRYIVAVTVH